MDEFSVTGGGTAAGGRRRRVWWWLLPAGVFVVGAVLLVGGFVAFVGGYRFYKVPSSVMSPTVASGDRVVAVKAVGGANVHRGDIVLFDSSVWRDGIYGVSIFRIVGVGGDTVSCCDGQNRLQVNGHSLDEDYVGRGAHPDSPATQRTFSATVPEGRVLVLGDDRGDSFDSRFQRSEIGDGSIPLSAIQRRVVGIYHGSRLTTIPPTAAFRNAGLTGPSAPDSTFQWVFASMGIGLVLTILSLVGTGVFGLFLGLRPVRR